jgi:hypothetical protein
LIGAASVAFALLVGGVGPPTNPCADPARHLQCPNIVMARPSQVWMEATRGHRLLLHATSSIDVRGRGPLDVIGRRIDARRMQAFQVIHRFRRADYLRRIPGGHVVFHRIPGQGSFWKFEDAARFELWSLGPEHRLRRTGEKLIYCLRDLRRTSPGPRSPRVAVHPGCSQDRAAQRVHLGTSVGWSDIYPSTYYEQYIDVTGLRGCFGLWTVADPRNRLWESDDADNASMVTVRLPRLKPGGGC